MEVSNPYYTINNGFLLQSRSSHRPFILFSEFVEVVLLPLDEFQMKIDGEVSDFSHGDHPQTLFFSHYLTCFFFFCSSSAELMKKEKIIVDAKVYIFAMGMVQAFFKPRELPILKQWSWTLRMRTRGRNSLCCYMGLLHGTAKFCIGKKIERFQINMKKLCEEMLLHCGFNPHVTSDFNIGFCDRHNCV